MNRVMLLLVATLLMIAGAQAAIVCTASSSGVAFGNFNPLPGQGKDTNDTISVTCTGTAGDSATYTVKLASGLGSFGTRKMVSGSDNLTYNLYKDSGCTQVLGDGSASTYTLSGSMTLVSSSATNDHVVYSRIASGQNTAKAHTYNDSLLITITYTY